MDTKKIRYHVQNIEEVVSILADLYGRCQAFAFVGSLGAGKTTLIRLLLEKWGVCEAIVSPTFTYVNRYENQKGDIFYHFDLYRMHSLDEFFQQGFNEYLYQPGTIALIEWPEIVMPLLTHHVCRVEIDYVSEQERLITIALW